MDGACTDVLMGLGWVLYDGPSLVAGGSGNVGAGMPYQAELAGLDDALLWLISNPHKLKNRQLCLVTDCQSAVAALKASKVKDAQVKNILDQAKLLATLGKVGIRWCQRGRTRGIQWQTRWPGKRCAAILSNPTSGWRTQCLAKSTLPGTEIRDTFPSVSWR
jgi:hypothetical protein